MTINPTDLGIQSPGQTTVVQSDVESQPLSQPAQTDGTTVNNPAAADYSTQGTTDVQSGGQDIPAPSAPTTYDDALSQAEYDVEHKRVELEVMQDYLGQLEDYLSNAPLTGDDRTNLMEAIARTRAEIRRRDREVSQGEQKISWMVNYGNEQDFDGDGLSNAAEIINGTDYLNPDTDGDGLTDGIETVLSHNPDRIGGQPISATSYDTDSNGFSDWDQFSGYAADAANSLGIDNWAYGRDGSGSGLSSDPYSSDPNSTTATDTTDTTQTPADSSGPVGPTPGDNAQTVDLAPATDQTTTSSTTDNAASSQSVNQGLGTMSAQSVTEPTTNSSMGIQGASDPTTSTDSTDTGGSTDTTPPRTKEDIKNDLWNKEYTLADYVEIGAEWSDGNMSSYKDVIINGTSGNDEFLVTQEGEDVLIRTPEKIIRVVKGSQRKIFINSPDGNADTLVFYNVPQQTVMGGTQAENGQNSWAHGIFIQQPTETGGYYSAGDAAAATDPAAGQNSWSWNEQPSGQTQDLGQWVAPTNPGIENVYTLWDVFQTEQGTVSDVVTKDGDPVLETNPETGTQYPLETWTMKSSSDPVYINIPPTVEQIPVWEVGVTAADNNPDDMVVSLSARDGTLLKKIYIKNGIKYGNTTPGDPSMIFKLPSGVNDPKGYYDNGYNFGGVYFHADTLTDNYVHVIGGAGNDKIVGSSFANAAAGETADYIDGGAGNDIIQTNTAAHIIGGKGDDVLQGSSQADLIEGGEGNDYIDGGFGADTIRGNSGNDFMVTRGTDNDIDGGVGDDLTNIAEENNDNNTVNNTEHALNNLVNSSETLTDLLKMMQLDGQGAQDVQDMVDQLKKEGIAAVGEKVYEMFGTVLGIYERSFLEGSNVDPNSLAMPNLNPGTDTTSSSGSSGSTDSTTTSTTTSTTQS